MEKCRKILYRKNSAQREKVKKCQRKIDYFENCIEPEDILPKQDWFHNFEKIWSPSEDKALKVLKNFIKNEIENYSEGRNFPNIKGTSKLSPFIKFGQIHVETIWNECKKNRTNKIGTSKYLAEIGWREFNHSLINFSFDVKK